MSLLTIIYLKIRPQIYINPSLYSKCDKHMQNCYAIYKCINEKLTHKILFLYKSIGCHTGNCHCRITPRGLYFGGQWQGTGTGRQREPSTITRACIAALRDIRRGNAMPFARFRSDPRTGRYRVTGEHRGAGGIRRWNWSGMNSLAKSPR